MEQKDLLILLNKNVSARFKDGKHIKTAEGRLVTVSDRFVKIVQERHNSD